MHATRRPHLDRNALVGVAAVLSLLAGYIHLLVMPEHFKEWWGYGTFFLVVAIGQMIYAGAILFRPRRAFLVIGIVGNLALMLFWLWTRIIGIPLVGPGAGERETVATIDLASKAVELALVIVLVALVRDRVIGNISEHPRPPGRRASDLRHTRHVNGT